MSWARSTRRRRTRREIGAASLELGHLGVESLEYPTAATGGWCGAIRRGWRLRSRPCAATWRLFAGRDQAAPQHLTFGFERNTTVLEFGHRVDGFLETPAGRATAGVGGLERAFDFGHLERQLLHALAAALGAGAQAVDLRAQAHVARAAARHDGLVTGQAVFEIAHAMTQRFQVCFGRAVLRLLRIERGALGAQAFLALDDALVRVLVATDPQPVRADPDAVARDDRLPGTQARSQVQGIAQRVGGDDAFEQRVESRGAADTRDAEFPCRGRSDAGPWRAGRRTSPCLRSGWRACRPRPRASRRRRLRGSRRARSRPRGPSPCRLIQLLRETRDCGRGRAT